MGILDRLFRRGEQEPKVTAEDDWLERQYPNHDAFEKVRQGTQLHAEGDLVSAELRFREGIATYRQADDVDGVAYALGRLGAFYQRTERPVVARATFEEALTLGTDIPATYYGLM